LIAGVSLSGQSASGASDSVSPTLAKGEAGSLGSVLAVVVTYNPGIDLARNLHTLCGQGVTVVVIDNGSLNQPYSRQVALDEGCRFIGNAVNLGIAAALNQAGHLALEEGFEWLAMFDQDSQLSPLAIEGLLGFYESYAQRDQIALLAMSHRDRVMDRDYHMAGDIIEETPIWRAVKTTITSGSMVRMSLFQILGFFDERLFIDSVDHDYCMRCRRAGFVVVESRSHVLEHSLGNSAMHNFLWRRVAITHHSSVRRYYLTRNQLEVCFRYLFFDFRWASRGLFNLVITSVLAITYETDRLLKIAAIFNGTIDFLLRRFGPRDSTFRQAGRTHRA
jgi:rhamnosyltransferase